MVRDARGIRREACEHRGGMMRRPGESQVTDRFRVGEHATGQVMGDISRPGIGVDGEECVLDPGAEPHVSGWLDGLQRGVHFTLGLLGSPQRHERHATGHQDAGLQLGVCGSPGMVEGRVVVLECE
jgi:hypothetical protein